MRIVAGQFKGRAIVAPKTDATRPTSDRARESLFNMLAHADYAPPLDGARVLDLFAGSGALGLEAISRGAAFCLFVETARAAQIAIRANIDTLGVSSRASLYPRSASELCARADRLGGRFDLVFMDPPYRKGLVGLCLSGLWAGDWLSEDALIVVETAVEEEPDVSAWTLVNERVSGAAKFWFLKGAAR